MNTELITDSLWALVAGAGTVLALVVAFVYSARFKHSKHFRRVLTFIMGLGVTIVVGAAVLTKFNRAPCNYQFDYIIYNLSFEPQTIDLKYSTRSGCPSDLFLRKMHAAPEGDVAIPTLVNMDSKTVAGREYYSARFDFPGNYSNSPRTIQFRPLGAGIVSATQHSPLDGLTGARREAVKIALEFYRKRVPFGDPNDPKSGKDPEKGFDTSGFVAYVLAKVGLIPEAEVKTKYWSGALQEKFGTPNVRSITELQPGDLLFEQNRACWFVLSQKQVLGSIPGAGVTVADPSTLGSPIVAYGRVSYPN